MDFDAWRKKKYSEDIAPTEESEERSSNDTMDFDSWRKKKYEENPRSKWFEKGAFEDGYQLGDVVKTILGTGRDYADNVNTAVVEATENLIDTTAYGVGVVGGLFNKDFQDNVGDFIAKDLLKAEKTGAAMSLLTPGGLLAQIVLGDETEENSLLGEKSEGMVQSAAHMVGAKALDAALPGIGQAAIAVNAFGSEIEEAYRNDAKHWEAGVAGTVAAGAELIFEKISSGIKIGKGGTFDEAFTKKISQAISNKVVRTMAKMGMDVVGEGAEEVLTEVATAFGRKLTYASEKEMRELLTVESLWDAFVGGAVMGAGGSAVQLGNSIATGRDMTTGMTADEDAVVRKLYEEQVTDDMTSKEKSKLFDDIKQQMERGELDIDDIERIVGGEDYSNWKKEADRQKALDDELNKLLDTEESKMTVRQRERLNELRAMESNKDMVEALKASLDEKIGKTITTESRLSESYKERARRGQAFEADLSKYSEKEAETVKKAVESGYLNNTRVTHDFVDLLARISAEKGVPFDFTTNKKLKESGFAIDGKQVNAYVNKDGIAINVNSAKSLHSVVGHELTHVFEGTDLYKELQKAVTAYAKSKGDYNARRSALAELYKGVEADIDAELTADLVGDYIFTDEAFVRNLSTQNKNLFQKIFDEIKSMLKIATAGSEQEKQLLEAKRLFEKVYRESEVKAAEGTRYSFSAINPDPNGYQFEDAERLELEGKSSEEIRQQTGWFRSYDDKWRYEIDDSKAVWHFDTAQPDPERLFYFGEKVYKLGNILEHEELYKAYPQLKDVTVYVSPNLSVDAAVMSGSTDSIAIKSLTDGFSKRRLLIHEIQHIIQNIEGFAKGASKFEYTDKEWTDKEYEALDKRNEVAKKLYAVLRRNGESLSNDDIYYSQHYSRIHDDVIESHYFQLQSLATNNKRTQALIDEYYDQVQILNATTPEGQYHATAGEIEAYDTMGRMQMSAEERKAVRPNIDRTDVIVKGVSEATTDQHSIKKTSQMSFNDQLKQIERKQLNGSNSLYIGTPAMSLQSVGLSNAPFAMNQSDYRKSRRKTGNNKNYSSHAVPLTFFEKMPQYLADAPMLIDNGAKVSVVTSFEMKDTNGNASYVIAGVWTNQQMDNDTINQVKSVYPLDDFAQQIVSAAESGKLVVINAKKAEQMLATIGVQPSELSRILDFSKSIISQNSEMSSGFAKNSAEDIAPTKFSLSPETDKTYLDAVSRGDTKTAQMMVDEAAKEWGAYVKRGRVKAFYHGTKKSFTVFDKEKLSDTLGFFFTEEKAEAQDYGEAYRFYLKIENPIDIWSDEYFMFSQIKSDAEKVKALQEAGYDGIESFSHGILWMIAFEPNQIKSADAVTYDDNGNVIPLSERFNSGNNDIRFSLSAEDEIAPTAGITGKDIALENIAPTREQIAEMKRVTTPKKVDNLPMREDIAPIKETPQKAEPKIAQVLTEESSGKKKGFDAWAAVKNLVLDKGMVFEDLALKTKNRTLQARWNSIRYANSKAQKMIGNGYGKAKALTAIRSEVENSGKTDEFYNYLYHKHNIDRMSLDKNKTAKSLGMKNKPVFGNDVTAKDSERIVAEYEKSNPQFKAWAKDVYDYMNTLREMLVTDGVISRETANLWAELYPSYVPIRRAGKEGLAVNVPLDTRRTGVNAPIRSAKGGNSDIEPLFGTMALRTEQTYRAIARNRFGIELRNTLGSELEASAQGVDETIDSIDDNDSLLKEGKDGKLPTFTVFENGKKVTFEITDEMYNAMKPTNEVLRYRNKVLNTATNIFRSLVTEYNPVFMIKNPIKDSQDVLINSQHPAKTYAAIPKAITEMAQNGKYYKEYIANGGEQNTYFESDSKTFTKEDEGIKKWIGMPLRKISEANGVIERIPRLAEYIASREAGRDIDVSMLDAARVTTNFAAGGDLTKALNRNGFTFLNASVQGAMQNVRNVREAKANGLKGWVQLAAKVTAAGLPALILNALLWDDDEEYDELSDYVKQNYYIIAKFGDGKFVRIPKGRTVAVIQNAFEQMKNLVTGDDDVDMQSFFDLVINNLAPNNPLENNVIAPIQQALTNKTWYGDDLVPARLQDLPAAEQYDESIDSISKWIGEKTNTSPYKWNYVLNQYSGVVGDILLPMLTPESDGGGLLAPFADAFTTDSTMKNQNVTDFYDTVEKLNTSAKSSKATDADVLKYKYMSSVNSEISDLYKTKRFIQNSNLTDKEKDDAVRKLQRLIDDLAKESLESYENVRIDGNRAAVGDKQYKYTNGEWKKTTDDKQAKKDRVVSYLKTLDVDYGEKLIIYRSVYKNDNTYNKEIVEYLSGRDDLSYDEVVSILEELGFTVKNGRVYWD